jgi:hypothetical protein
MTWNLSSTGLQQRVDGCELHHETSAQAESQHSENGTGLRNKSVRINGRRYWSASALTACRRSRDAPARNHQTAPNPEAAFAAIAIAPDRDFLHECRAL